MRTVDRVYQGVRFSDSFLGYFNQILDAAFDDTGKLDENFKVGDVYLPFTNENDIDVEFALIPNTHQDVKPTTARAYYDGQWIDYKRRLKRHGIDAISTFAIVDPLKDKNHTGWFWVKVQRVFDDGYGYVVCKVNCKDGQLAMDQDGNPDMQVFASEANTILCVCEDDYLNHERLTSDGVWVPVVGDIPLVKSTTSSHYSVFNQRIPDYDLKYVRNYLQFKTRLDGMELCLEHLKRNIHLKEVRASECFANEAVAIQMLFKEFTGNEEVMSLVAQYYNLVGNYDKLYLKYLQIQKVRDDKIELVNGLLAQYNSLGDKDMDKKLELGQKIQSIKLELGKTIQASIDSIRAQLNEMLAGVSEINARIKEVQSKKGDVPSIEKQQELLQALKEMFNKDNPDSRINKMKEEIEKMVQGAFGESRELIEVDSPKKVKPKDETEQPTSEQDSSGQIQVVSDVLHEKPDPLSNVDVGKLRTLIRQSERWSRYMHCLGYELQTMEEMYVKCEDATIMVRRLVHNFEEKMQRIESDVWDENHTLKEDFNFAGIASSGLREIILLHDWYACNAPGKTPSEMGFSSDKDFMDFRRRCNKVAYNLRKNQYAKMLKMRKVKVEELIDELKSKKENKDTLKYDDKYGSEAKKSEGKEWSEKDITKSQEKVVRLLSVGAAKAFEQMAAAKKQYEADQEKMEERTMSYLKDIGIAENEEDLEHLAAVNLATKYEGNVAEKIGRIEALKSELAHATETMNKQRNALQSIIDSIYAMEKKMQELEEANKRLFNACLIENKRPIRNRLLLEKLENEEKILELKGLVKKTRKENLSDLSSLERMKKAVDKKQAEYDAALSEFKNDIGLNEEAMSNLMVSIYNKYQDEILAEGK